MVVLRYLPLLLALATMVAPVAFAQEDTTDTRPGIAPDIRDDDTRLKVQRGNFVVVPIPISDPTLGDGLIAGAAYFYPQTEEEKGKQPASLTAAAGMYTNNDSRVFGLAQQNYWKNNRWRFTGAVGAADLRLSLLAPDETVSGVNVDWRIKGEFLYAKLARRLAGNWYIGGLTRLIDADQTIETEVGSLDFDTGSAIVSAGLGVLLEYDTRDNPFNSSSGRYFTANAVINDESLGSNSTYQSYNAAFSSYHRLTESLVLAWELQGCTRGAKTPLWDACTVKLRGFPATDYLGKTSSSGQAEARWQLSDRWGLAAFAGVGYVVNSFSEIDERDPIPSYGAGIRFTVLKAKRINLRIDYARSSGSDAVHVSVGEAF